MTRFVVANLYVGNKHIDADMRLLRSLDFDVAFVCEATRWWRKLNPLGRIHTGRRDGRKALREVGTVTRFPVLGLRLVRLCGDTGKPAGQERFAVVNRCRIDGVPTTLISVHLDAALGFDANYEDHKEGLRKIVRLAKDEMRDGFSPVIGGDFNDRGRTAPFQTAAEAFAEIGLRYRYHRLDGLAYDPKVWRFEDKRVVEPRGSDHKWVVVDLTPRNVEPEVPEEEPEMKFVSREAWGARPGATPSSHPIGQTFGVTFHWEGPKMGGFTHDRCTRLVQSIQRYHQITKGWADIAYNAVVCPHGYVFEGRGLWTKSAANGYVSVNDDWYAVCYLGGMGDGFTEAGKEGFVAARDWLVRHGGAGRRVNGHRDHKPTTCPGDAIYHWLKSRTWGEPTNHPEEDDMPEPKDLWDHRLPNYSSAEKGDTARARVLLAQAHNRAGDARRAAAEANRRAARIEKALAALADGLGAEVGAAVREALKDAVVEVDVTVESGDEPTG